jgi:hypothetical protein
MPVIDIPLDHTHADRHEYCRDIMAALGFQGAGCEVAVLDTGIDPGLISRVKLPLQGNVTAHDFTRRGEGWREPSEQPHGSRIVIDILRAAPLATVHSLRVNGASLDADRDDHLKALDWCARHRIGVANLSFVFYDGCSNQMPCQLCRGINSAALSSDLFCVIASGDAYTLGSMLNHGKAPLLCPASHTPFAWAVASPEVVMPGAVVIKNKEGGLSFTTGKFTAGLAQLRGAMSGSDLFSIRRAIRRTCIPSPYVTEDIGGFGRHCFLMAWLGASGTREHAAGRLSFEKTASLRQPLGPGPGGADIGVVRAMQALVGHLVMRQRWRQARDKAEEMLALIEPWGGVLDVALVRHVRAACREAVGDDVGAGVDYDAVRSMADAGFAAPATGVAQ